MIQRTFTTSNRACAQALIETDRSYFEMAAEIQPLSNGVLAWMPGLTNLAASCVVHRVEPNGCPCDESWLHEIECQFADRCIPLARIYVEHCSDALRQLLLQQGYQCRVEMGFLAAPGHGPPPSEIELQEVVSADNWQAKFALHQESMHGPDGYTNPADLWVEMERRKCATGSMRTFLVRYDGQVTGTVGTIVHRDGLLRLKNILIAPRYRRLGLAVAVVRLLRCLADRDYDSRLGVFGVAGGDGSRIYRRAGMTEYTYQYEWSRSLIGNSE